MCHRTIVVSLVLLLLATHAGAGGTRTAHVVFVPWKVMNHDSALPADALVLYWIPSSPDELRRSQLVTSRALSVYAARCVGMHVVRADDEARIEKFGVGELLPVALLMNGEQEVGRVANRNGALDADAVAHMVREAFDARELLTLERAAEARRLAEAGQTAAAVERYRRVAQERCAFPRLARDAQRALRKLGVR
jgi:hypothetical protein